MGSIPSSSPTERLKKLVFPASLLWRTASMG